MLDGLIILDITFLDAKAFSQNTALSTICFIIIFGSRLYGIECTVHCTRCFVVQIDLSISGICLPAAYMCVVAGCTWSSRCEKSLLPGNW